MSIEVLPLPKRFVIRCNELGIAQLRLNFSGGSDEGYVNTDCGFLDGFKMTNLVSSFLREIEDWAHDSYDYSGDGDGSCNEYGDDITYDLVKSEVIVQGWWTERCDGDPATMPLECSDDEDE